MTNENHFAKNVAHWIENYGDGAPAEFERRARPASSKAQAEPASSKAQAEHLHDLAMAAQAELLVRAKRDR
jgi:hypothetical protein